ncbi:PAS domain-containing protein [Rubellimicrobium roseum]|uniref:PAS domain-containing protein n=1 Tax=Rubellimicrobium roseum TaxID=687525 RepID=A0A5C4NA33_9RHOB|nr:PAS domain-containing protein [Rubellimicrobium roseum]TNC59368.1 PAS domain-containing protein [Rubellimicrobium roseum]
MFDPGEVTHVEYRIIRPVDGSVRWLRDTSFPIRDDAGAVIRIGGITEGSVANSDQGQGEVSGWLMAGQTRPKARCTRLTSPATPGR